MNLFEQASRLSIRFTTPKGFLMVEDLWDLPLTSTTGAANLDSIAKGLNKQLKEADTESFVVKAKALDTILQLKFDIVKHIIEVRLEENETAKTAKDKKEKKQKLLSLIAQKQDEKLLGLSLEDLQKEVESL
jgi:hypothetical protein